MSIGTVGQIAHPLQEVRAGLGILRSRLMAEWTILGTKAWNTLHQG